MIRSFKYRQYEELPDIIKKNPNSTFDKSSPQFMERFKEWAASWDCKEAETDGQDSPMIGDEIEVGTLWEDKSQKDFKSYL